MKVSQQVQTVKLHVALSWTLPYPHGVNVNHLYEPRAPFYHKGKLVTGARRLTAEARAWKEQIGLIVRDGGMPTVPAGKLALLLEVYVPDETRRDLDGVIKACQDGIAEGLQIDDRRIDGLLAVKILDRGNPRIEARLVAMDEALAQRLREILRDDGPC